MVYISADLVSPHSSHNYFTIVTYFQQNQKDRYTDPFALAKFHCWVSEGFIELCTTVSFQLFVWSVQAMVVRLMLSTFWNTRLSSTILVWISISFSAFSAMTNPSMVTQSIVWPLLWRRPRPCLQLHPRLGLLLRTIPSTRCLPRLRHKLCPRHRSGPHPWLLHFFVGANPACVSSVSQHSHLFIV